MTEESVTVTQFTDPLCAWSWDAEPTIRALSEHYRGQLTVEFVMTELTSGHSEPAQSVDVTSHWRDAARYHSMPINADKWCEIPSPSSRPSSLAYKAAELQDGALARRYLRRLRAAAATERVDLEHQPTLCELATAVGLDGDRLSSDLGGNAAHTALQADLDRARSHAVTALPTYSLTGPSGTTWLYGNTSLESFEAAIADVSPPLDPVAPRPLGEFVDAYGSVTAQEVATVYDVSVSKAGQALKAMADDFRIRPVERGNGTFWYSPVDPLLLECRQ
ncbi:DsbA family oxidoreductase [Natronobiforma cellulositropha]|uniref:DsbA family oxidoreductase n=1 Tax=Natronobiforma cellulositropha TaxID=1679076 RepID=UPI0021D5ED60|nr:DsbA family protein [Natronobiforma cellulositropha]